MCMCVHACACAHACVCVCTCMCVGVGGSVGVCVYLCDVRVNEVQFVGFDINNQQRDVKFKTFCLLTKYKRSIKVHPSITFYMFII